MKKRTYVLNGHPGGTSLSKRLAEIYAQAAISADHDVRVTHLHDLAFDPDLGEGSYKALKPQQEDLKVVAANLEWSEHIVLLTPMWWGGVPATLKGLFDLVLLPGFAFDTRQKTPLGLPKPLLGGRTARLIMTSDTPDWFFRLAYGRAMVRQLRAQVFGFVGIKPLRVTHFSEASHPTSERVEKWSEEVAALGRAAQ